MDFPILCDTTPSYTKEKRISFLLNRRGCGINQLPATELTHFGKKRGDRLLCVLYHIRSTSSSMTQLSFWNKKTFASDSSHTRAATQKDRRHLLRKFSDVISRRRKSQVYIFHIYHTHITKILFSIDC